MDQAEAKPEEKPKMFPLIATIGFPLVKALLFSGGIAAGFGFINDKIEERQGQRLAQRMAVMDYVSDTNELAQENQSNLEKRIKVIQDKFDAESLNLVEESYVEAKECLPGCIIGVGAGS